MEIKAIGCEPLQLKRVGMENGHTLKVYQKTGGYESLKKALKMTPADIIEEVKKSASVTPEGGVWQNPCRARRLATYTGPIRLPRG